MRNHDSKRKPHDNESIEEEQENIQPIRRRTGEEDEEEIAEEDLDENLEDDDHSMETLDEDDLANMQGPDA